MRRGSLSLLPSVIRANCFEELFCFKSMIKYESMERLTWELSNA